MILTLTSISELSLPEGPPLGVLGFELYCATITNIKSWRVGVKEMPWPPSGRRGSTSFAHCLPRTWLPPATETLETAGASAAAWADLAVTKDTLSMPHSQPARAFNQSLAHVCLHSHTPGLPTPTPQVLPTSASTDAHNHTHSQACQLSSTPAHTSTPVLPAGTLTGTLTHTACLCTHTPGTHGLPYGLGHPFIVLHQQHSLQGKRAGWEKSRSA